MHKSKGQGYKAPSPRSKLAMARTGVSESDLQEPTYEQMYLRYRDKTAANSALESAQKRRQMLLDALMDE